ncbi:hypothetical protein QBC34DRAFT_408108 [Podospora aff. communis PSN243]|uniref:Secreted protein n=1 Tax=Podospora aff. communis PSN243 TaxID=3040156 RepID=A0AAV9GN56_9PEZI|nr:hypothetical protein QBC34DRAFT_408108 [Podospora aff. communis PSN243]
MPFLQLLWTVLHFSFARSARVAIQSSAALSVDSRRRVCRATGDGISYISSWIQAHVLLKAGWCVRSETLGPCQIVISIVHGAL